jgi:transcriptional regulator with XRE-family HTH domain
MPFNHEAMARRRRLLGMTQQDVAITAGLSLTLVQRVETNVNPQNGSRMAIDTLMRIAESLQMDPRELLISPIGNRYERSVQFALHQQSPLSSPKLHDPRRTVRASGYRKLTHGYAAADTIPIIEREEPDAPAVAVEPAPVEYIPTDFQPDPSSE